MIIKKKINNKNQFLHSINEPSIYDTIKLNYNNYNINELILDNISIDTKKIIILENYNNLKTYLKIKNYIKNNTIPFIIIINYINDIDIIFLKKFFVIDNQQYLLSKNDIINIIENNALHYNKL